MNQEINSALTASVWSQSEGFSRTYTMFGLIMLLLMISQTVFQNFKLTILNVFYLPIFWCIEIKISDVMKKMAVSSSYFNRKPLFLIPYIFILIGIEIFGFYISRYTDLIKCTNLFSTYFSALFVSVLFFIISSIIKLVSVVTGIVNFKYIRRGFFGIFQRFFLIIRNFSITSLWVAFFSSNENPTFLDIFISHSSPYCMIYVVFKCFIQLWLLWDFGFAIRDYRMNGKAALTSVPPEEVHDDCCICLDHPYEPVKLSCGHIFCYKCAFRWLTFHNTCPLCCAQVMESKQIEFADGFMPIASLFGCF
ncbi:E3 ubiquitin-protein ligase rnf5 [Tritrichomonas musculus]|uniref:E3 ubiquitin-protein ligase rnf5 n=1 Tax=Tritrichomonas musculus TaxID=1915356 RepID=A0ABR2JTF7_9EUKA